MTWLLAIGGFLKKLPWWAYAAAAVLLVGWLYGNARYDEGRADERAKWEAAQAAAKERGDKATVDAAEQRARDTIRNSDLERARNEAIDKAAPGGAPDDANRRLACERLRASRPDFDAAAAGC